MAAANETTEPVLIRTVDRDWHPVRIEYCAPVSISEYGNHRNVRRDIIAMFYFAFLDTFGFQNIVIEDDAKLNISPWMVDAHLVGTQWQRVRHAEYTKVMPDFDPARVRGDDDKKYVDVECSFIPYIMGWKPEDYASAGSQLKMHDDGVRASFMIFVCGGVRRIIHKHDGVLIRANPSIIKHNLYGEPFEACYKRLLLGVIVPERKKIEPTVCYALHPYIEHTIEHYMKQVVADKYGASYSVLGVYPCSAVYDRIVRLAYVKTEDLPNC